MTSTRSARQPWRGLLLVSAASCAGKTTVRTLVAPELEPEVEAVEL